MRKFAVAGLQLDVASANNMARIGAEIMAAKRVFPWLAMIVLPELVACGTDLGYAEAQDGPLESAFRQMARDNRIWLLPGSIYQRQGHEVFNVAPLIDPAGEIVARYRKMFPFRPYETGVTPGRDFCAVPIGDAGTLGVSICYDLWFPEVARSLAWLGAEVLVCPSLTNTIDRDVELALARANAAANQCYVINVNVGAPLGMGKSIVCGPGGEVLHLAGSGFDLFPIELDFDYVARVRRRGWHHLGQPLKSFRDAPRRFPAYHDVAPSAALEALGALEMPAMESVPT